MSTINKHSCICYFSIFLLAVFIRAAIAQSPAPAPAGAPDDIMAILKKAGHFTTLMRLMKMTQVARQINKELVDPNDGMTFLAPNDGAFAALPPGTLNGLNDEQQVNLLEFHMIPAFLSPDQLQTASNPIRTKAGDDGPYGFPLYATTNGTQVIMSSGINNSTITNPFYSDNQLAIYEVDKVLQPMAIFGPKPPPAPAQAPAPPKKKKSAPEITAEAPSVPQTVDASGDVGLRENAVVSLVAAATLAVFWF